MAVNKSLNFETMASEIGQEPRAIANSIYESGSKQLTGGFTPRIDNRLGGHQGLGSQID